MMKKMKCFFARLNLDTKTGIPELDYLEESSIEKQSETALLLYISKIVPIYKEEKLYLTSSSKEELISYIYGFIDSHKLSGMRPSKMLNLHTMN